MGNAFSVSAITHVVALLLFLFVLTLPGSCRSPDGPEMLSLKNIVWTADPGPGGGGGGGGNKTPEPPRKAELPDKDKITVPRREATEAGGARTAQAETSAADEHPGAAVAQGVEALPGAVSQRHQPRCCRLAAAPAAAQAPARARAAVAGQGSGLGPGTGGGFGGGAYRPGNGVTQPRLIREVKPNYTPEAMRAKIQGVVWLEAVVMENGSVGQVRVTRSLDPTFGLDLEAERTVKKWIFAPGTRLGQPVPVVIEIEMSFTLR